MTTSERVVVAALTVLIILQVVMLMSLYAGVLPHPPMQTPLFGIGPFIGASVAITSAAIFLGPLSLRSGRFLSGAAIAFALVSFGPQKYFDAQFGLIWPAVMTAQMACAVAVFQLFRRERPADAAGGPLA